MATLYLAVVLVALSAWNLVSSEQYFSYSRQQYPNPLIESTRCGRETIRKSYVCDPDLILGPKDKEASQLDALIAKIINETSCPCASYSCERHRGGYKIGIALMRKMRFDDSHDEDDKGHDGTGQIRRNLDEAKLYANEIQRKWNNKATFGHCDEDVVIFYSHEDSTVYTSTGRVARLKLTDDLVASITLDARYTGFTKGVFDGLWKIVNEYRAVFLGIYHLKHPQASASREGNAAGSVDAPFALNFFAVTFVLGSYAIYRSP